MPLHVYHPQLRAYAIRQKPLTEWDGHDKGFVMFRASWSLSKEAITYALIPTATVLLLVVGIAFSFKLVTKLSNLNQGYQAHVKISLFWSFISVLHITNFIEVAIQLLLIIFPALETSSASLNLSPSSYWEVLEVAWVTCVIREDFLLTQARESSVAHQSKILITARHSVTSSY